MQNSKAYDCLIKQLNANGSEKMDGCGKEFGGTNTDTAPCTRNGFTGARNGEIVPEWTVNGNLEPIEGAELHKVIDSEDSIVAIFDGEHFREVVK